ncbi:class I SAM-dependent methyltransferase [Xanthovirga aplysinae]|uniref:class I SAM-dependent methyltransferase n=1 Tax=Xanthovirga aplysinae TaxID=2529853 RepID=UPI0012BCE325|nr:class I SAM-dependent methyltransferase [Xanthovirga aplysinae]MTI32301.1 class I SAM-dependent methyltransferase [Xanthovirga aplysinae]
MKAFDRKKHWENIYQTKALHEVSWYQPTPQDSLDFVKELNIPKTAKIIDVGGGDSLFVDHLLDLGYQDITVLDISSEALDRAKNRLGERAQQVKWVVSDVTKFKTSELFDFWHDRAAFHFLTEEADIHKYLEIVQQRIKTDGFLILGTFSEKGPKKCSGIEIKQYSEDSLTARMQEGFEKLKCIQVKHHTPFDTIQDFTFCSFRRLGKG